MTSLPALEVPREAVRLLLQAPGQAPRVVPIAGLPGQLRPGDVLVLNDAATLPASLPALAAGGLPVEARLFDPRGVRWAAVLFGPGDCRQRTEDRPPPPRVRPGERLRFPPGPLEAVVAEVDPRSHRLVELEFQAPVEAVWRHLYARGAPVQYAHRPAPAPLYAVQNAYGARPWAAETPSAGRPLTLGLLLELRRRGVEVVALTHGTALSATGDPALDAALPLPEAYELPPATAAAVERARAEGRRVVAVGTSAMRALEAAGAAGAVRAGPGRTALVIDEHHRPRVVAGLLTGLHAPGESHYRLLRSLLPEPDLVAALALARAEGLVPHELGDVALLWAAEPAARG